MAPRRKIIIDTDPGVDDILSLLLALTSQPDELDLLLISLTYGNVEVDKCLRNVVSLFHHIHEEIKWREQTGRRHGFDVLQRCRPLVAVGASNPLADQMLMADYFHGVDGLGGISHSHPHLTPEQTWEAAFKPDLADEAGATNVEDELRKQPPLFSASRRPAHEEILRLLAEHEQDEITIVTIGPMTNAALAAAYDTNTFLKVREVVVMGGAIKVPGNITPVGEFNTFADSYAAARVYALTSPKPQSTMPPVPPTAEGKTSAKAPPPHLSAYPSTLSRRLTLTLFPLDITSKHKLTRGSFRKAIEPLKAAGSPLATWADAFVSATFRKIESLGGGSPDGADGVSLEMHDPLCIWYCLYGHGAEWRLVEEEDLRVETSGQWTRGMCVVDDRARLKRDDDLDGNNKGDTGNWLSTRAGNRLRRCVDTPGGDAFVDVFLTRVFGI